MLPVVPRILEQGYDSRGDSMQERLRDSIDELTEFDSEPRVYIPMTSPQPVNDLQRICKSGTAPSSRLPGRIQGYGSQDNQRHGEDYQKPGKASQRSLQCQVRPATDDGRPLHL